jgi:hypothetical protein
MFKKNILPIYEYVKKNGCVLTLEFNLILGIIHTEQQHRGCMQIVPVNVMDSSFMLIKMPLGQR